MQNGSRVGVRYETRKSYIPVFSYFETVAELCGSSVYHTAYEEDIATKMNGSYGFFSHYSDSGVRDYAQSASFGYASSERGRSYRCKTEALGN